MGVMRACFRPSSTITLSRFIIQRDVGGCIHITFQQFHDRFESIARFDEQMIGVYGFPIHLAKVRCFDFLEFRFRLSACYDGGRLVRHDVIMRRRTP